MKLQSISQPIHTIFAFASHPITATALTTLFFATVVQATTQSDLKDAEVSYLGSFADWLAKDTAIKVGTFALVVITAAILWKSARPKPPVQIARTAVETEPRNRTERKGPGSAPMSTLPRPKTTLRADLDKESIPSFQQRLLDHGVAETPGGINLTPFQMKEKGEAALRKDFIYPQQNALLSYTLAAHYIILGKLLAAKAEGIKGYKFVEVMRGEIKSDLRSLIEQCKFLISESQQVQGKKRAEGSQSLKMAIPETPGGVNLTPLQMKEKGESALRVLFTSPVQDALLCYTLAADLMIEGKYSEAKEEIKRGFAFVKSSKEQIKADLHAQYLACKELEKQPPAKLDASSIFRKPLPQPPQEEEPEANSNAPVKPIPEVPESPQQVEFRPPTPPPFPSNLLQDAPPPPPPPPPFSFEVKGPRDLPPPPVVEAKGPPPPTPSRLPPPPMAGLTHSRARSSSVDGVGILSNALVANKIEDINPRKSVLRDIKQVSLNSLKKAPRPLTTEEKIEESDPLYKALKKVRVVHKPVADDDGADWGEETKKKTVQTPSKSKNGNNVLE